jgi:hypothetical protein
MLGDSLLLGLESLRVAFAHDHFDLEQISIIFGYSQELFSCSFVHHPASSRLFRLRCLTIFCLLVSSAQSAWPDYAIHRKL